MPVVLIILYGYSRAVRSNISVRHFK